MPCYETTHLPQSTMSKKHSMGTFVDAPATDRSSMPPKVSTRKTTAVKPLPMEAQAAAWRRMVQVAVVKDPRMAMKSKQSITNSLHQTSNHTAQTRSLFSLLRCENTNTAHWRMVIKRRSGTGL